MVLFSSRYLQVSFSIFYFLFFDSWVMGKCIDKFQNIFTIFCIIFLLLFLRIRYISGSRTQLNYHKVFGIQCTKLIMVIYFSLCSVILDCELILDMALLLSMRILETWMLLHYFEGTGICFSQPPHNYFKVLKVDLKICSTTWSCFFWVVVGISLIMWILYMWPQTHSKVFAID